MSELQAREREGVTIVDVSGSMSGNAVPLHAAVSECIWKGSLGVVINLKDTSYLDSTWLGAIVQNFAKLSQVGVQLKLLNPPPELMHLFVATHLSEIFDIFTSEEDAVNSFFVSRPIRYPHMMRAGASLEPRSKGKRSSLAVFLCHSSTDKVAVRDLRTRLLRTGAKPWLDEVDLLPGQVWEREIPAAVHRSDAVLVCLSSTSVGTAGYLQREIKYAIDAAEEQSDDSIFLIPGRLEPCNVPERLRKWQWVDLFDPDGYERLVTALQARALALGRSLMHFDNGLQEND